MRDASSHSEAGFTLVEVLVAVALLFLGLSSAWVGVLAVERMGLKAESKGVALGLAVSEMERVRASAPSQLSDTSYAAGGLIVFRQIRRPKAPAGWMTDSSTPRLQPPLIDVYITKPPMTDPGGAQGSVILPGEDALAHLVLFNPDYR